MRLFIYLGLVSIVFALLGCPFGSKNESPSPSPHGPSNKEIVEVLKLDWDTCSVVLQQSSRTIENSANMIKIYAYPTSSCKECNQFDFAFVSEDQCGRDGWECYNRGNINLEFQNIDFGLVSGFGFVVNKGSKIIIASNDNSVLFSGITDSKDYQIKKIEIESFNDTRSYTNGDVYITTPECPGVNNNMLFSRQDPYKANSKNFFSGLLKNANSQKWALALKIKDLGDWCKDNFFRESDTFKTSIHYLHNEKFTLQSPTSGVTGTGELISQDIAELLIAKRFPIPGEGSNYWWHYDEITIKSPTITKTFYKRGVTNENNNRESLISDQNFHFVNKDSVRVIGKWYMDATWKFTDKNCNAIMISGKSKDGYSFDNKVFKIDLLEKNKFNYTREIDLSKFVYGEIQDSELFHWYLIAEKFQIPELKFQVIAKMVPYR